MLGDRTGPPQKTAVQLAAGGGHLEVLEELARYTTQVDWLVRQAVSSPHFKEAQSQRKTLSLNNAAVFVRCGEERPGMTGAGLCCTRWLTLGRGNT